MTSYFVHEYFLLKVRKNLELIKLASGPFGCVFMRVSPFLCSHDKNEKDIILGCPASEMIDTLKSLTGEEGRIAREKLLDVDKRCIYILVYSTNGDWDTFIVEKNTFSFPPIISLKVSGRC